MTRPDLHEPKISSFEALPSEIIHSILSLLSGQCLINVSQTCPALREHAHNDLLWARLVQENVPNFRSEKFPTPYSTFRDLYMSQHPYWFIPRGKIWICDRTRYGDPIIGTLYIARYDPSDACIKAYQVVGHRQSNLSRPWEWDPEVHVYLDDPEANLMLSCPEFVLRCRAEESGGPLHERRGETPKQRAFPMTVFLCRPVYPHLRDSNMRMWPPNVIPCESQSIFEASGHKLRNLHGASDRIFHVRMSNDFYGTRLPAGCEPREHTLTYTTLSQELYSSSKEKPWQGIWVGDYLIHGCEFLLIRQFGPIVSEGQLAVSKPSRANSPTNSVGSREGDSKSQPTEASPSSIRSDLNRANSAEEVENGLFQGRLEAIKLTGDHNVPRCEYSWIANDIGPQGLVRVADEEMFRGARIVHSIAHIADRDFENGS